MPTEGVKLSARQNLLTTDEVIHVAELFLKQGVTKIHLTGGEPTIQNTFVILLVYTQSCLYVIH
jgi:cyclic pyranopterin phosphate synthase